MNQEKCIGVLFISMCDSHSLQHMPQNEGYYFASNQTAYTLLVKIISGTFLKQGTTVLSWIPSLYWRALNNWDTPSHPPIVPSSVI